MENFLFDHILIEKNILLDIILAIIFTILKKYFIFSIEVEHEKNTKRKHK